MRFQSFIERAAECAAAKANRRDRGLPVASASVAAELARRGKAALQAAAEAYADADVHTRFCRDVAADWQWQRSEILEDFRRAIYPERYEEFTL